LNKVKQTIDVSQFNELNEIVKDNITAQSGTGEMRRTHTEMLIRCSAGDKTAKKYVKSHIRTNLIEEGIKNEELLNELTDKIYSKNWGLGHLDKYDTDEVDEIMVHGTKILIQVKGEIKKVPEEFSSYDETIAIIRRCLEFDKSKDINEKNCIALTKRIDGSRVTATIPRVGKMPYLNIRKFDSFLPTTENMLKSKTITDEMVEVFKILAKGRANIVVIGEMGSGKTTFMKWLLGFMPDDLVVGTLETTFELHLEKLYPDKHWIQLEEQYDYELKDLFAVMLRQNVDVMLVGESRSYEVNELIKAMSRGHSGSIGTAHSLGPMEVVDDFADMILESGKKVDLEALKYRIARAVDIVIKFRKLPNRQRVCAGIYEIEAKNKNMEYNAIPIFEFEMDEENPNDQGTHVKRNNISEKLKKKLNEYGVRRSEIDRVFPEEE
jgi:pilus assembly protein CpaF